MGFAEDKVYDHILKNLKNFKNIRVASLADSLSCLTDADRDELHSREETRGSQATVYRFYQHLRCRQGWVLDLINALHQNNAGHLADELQHVYDSWQARSPATAAASFPPGTNNAHPAAARTGAQTLSPRQNPAPDAPFAEQQSQDLPTGIHPPLLPSAATATSMDRDARTPVQESLPQTLQEQERPQPPPPGSTICDGVSDGHSSEGHLSHPIEVVQVAPVTPGAASVAVPSAVSLERGRDWLSRPQHPVCVDNGCFGNANHLHRGVPGLGLHRPLPPRDVGMARRPEQPKNEPQEDLYISTGSPPRLEETARREEPQAPDSSPKKRVVPNSEHSEPPGSFVDVRSPLLIQQQFDAEQKQVRMLQEDGGDGDTCMETTTPVAALAPRDASPPSNTSLKPPVQKEKPPVEEMVSRTPSMASGTPSMASSTCSMPTKEKVGSSEGTSARTASQVSSAMSIWTSCSRNVERDVELSKPSASLLTAGESLEAAERYPSSQKSKSHSSNVAGSLSFSSDPIMVSTDSSRSEERLCRVSSGCPAPAACADPREEEAARASRDSHPSSSWDSTSLVVHEVRVDHYPSTQLEAGNDLRDGINPLGNTPVLDSSRGPGSATSSSEARVPPEDNNGPSLLYILPGIAVISVVAFLVYARLRK
ncbi:MAVS protein, partial [Bucco capensis]|nr:MAVS protein [Bucco capensis]